MPPEAVQIRLQQFTTATIRRDGHVIGLKMHSLTERNSLQYSGTIIDRSRTQVQATTCSLLIVTEYDFSWPRPIYEDGRLNSDRKVGTEYHQQCIVYVVR